MPNHAPVILVMIDGLRPDALDPLAHPHLTAFGARGAVAPQAASVMPSLTLPCHMSIFHSVPPTRHGVVSNDWVPPARPLPGLVERATAAGKQCQFFYSWEPLRNLSPPGHLRLAYFRDHLTDPDGDQYLAEIAGTTIRTDHPDFAFVYFGNVDIAGHYYGWMSEGYLGQVARADAAFGTLLGHLPATSNVLVLSDHGGHDRTHGTDCPEDMAIVWRAAGPGIRSGITLATPVSLLDAAPTLAHLLDIAPHAEWEGRCVSEMMTTRGSTTAIW